VFYEIGVYGMGDGFASCLCRHRCDRKRNADGMLRSVGQAALEQGGLVERARNGDEQAFRELIIDPYRRELLAHCYRMLGSLTEAEDMLQETLLSAWRGLPRFEGRSSLRSWLYRIATNTCLNAIRSTARRPPAEPTPPFQPPEPTQRSEITWLEPYPGDLLDAIPDSAPGPEARYNQTEAIQLAFVAGLQRMPPRQAATVLLRDVLGFGTDEVAAMLETSQTAVKGTLQRGRAVLKGFELNGVGPEVFGSDAERSPGPSSAAENDLARRFADAYVAADIDRILALLTDDAWLSMPPAPHQYHGLDAIRSFLHASFDFRAGRSVYLLPGRANNQPAFASYLGDPEERLARPSGFFVLTLGGERIAAITRFHRDDLYPRLGFPSFLPMSAESI
jgi:RNA polymerase sigma-70 factor (TIGR02960 family)